MFEQLQLKTDFVAEGTCADIKGSDIYTFGGIDIQKCETQCDEPADAIPHNKLYNFSIDNGSLTELVKDDNIPSSTFSTLSSVGDYLYIFGGLTMDDGWINDFYRISIRCKVWEEIEAEAQRPSPRDKHAAAVIGPCIYIFGGFGPVEPASEEEEDDGEDFDEKREQIGATFTWFNDLHFFNTDNQSWSNPMLMSLKKPAPRAGATMDHHDNRLVLFGGKTSAGRQNDVHFFDPAKRVWTCEVETSGTPPPPRSFHASCVVKNYLVVCGGRDQDNMHLSDLHLLDLDSLCWMSPNKSLGPMEARSCHVIAPSGDWLYILGGVADFDASVMTCTTKRNKGYRVKTDDVISACKEEKDQNGSAAKIPRLTNAKENSPQTFPATNGH